MKTLKEIYQANEELNYIDSSLYSRYRVKAGLRNDNGTGVKVGLTKICDVIGYKFVHEKKYNIDGQLIYRGYPINYLVDKQPKDRIFGFEEVAFLLIFGTLPTEEQLQEFKDYLLNFKMGPVDLQYETPNILNALQIEVLKLYAKDPSADTDDLEERMMKGLNILASIPLFTFSYARNKVFKSYPYPDKSLAENILCMARGNDQYTLEEARILDTLLMVHADHGGGNNSTFANVVISSTGTDIYNCIHAFEKVAVEVMKERKGIDVCANVDYYSGYVYSLLGIENDLFTPLFAISRTAGWVSHHLENRQSNRKLIRPANVYVGEMEENE